MKRSYISLASKNLTEKTCKFCGVIKPLLGFVKHINCKQGRTNKCLDCDAIYNKAKNIRRMSDHNNAEIIREKDRVRSRVNPKIYNPIKAKKIIETYQQKFPEKIEANRASKFQRTKGLEQHHWSYNEKDFLDTIFLTKQDHMKAHRFILYDAFTKMYRTKQTNELLSSKEKHFYFINNCILNEKN